MFLTAKRALQEQKGKTFYKYGSYSLFFLFLFSPPSWGTEVTPAYCQTDPQVSAGSSSWGETIDACTHRRAGLVHQVPKEVVEDKPLLQSSASLAQAEVRVQCLHRSRPKRSLKRIKPLLGILWSLPPAMYW